MEATLWVPAVLIVIGMVGIVIPVIPGLLLCLAGVFVWAFDTKTTLGWSVFGVCAALYLAGLALQYAVPGRRMREAGVRRSTLVLAVLLAVVGFFVIPVVGAAVGFVGGIFLVELGHSQDRSAAWASTKAALKAVFLSMGIELLAALAIAVTWVVGVLLSRG
ncbi:DUF456 domain-containing protein [Phycicoccus sp. Soil803]|uniref:DUF456 domain-containing protein n=1 Tax=Phycicoccus sp. Soil803 TaxID=1736415 RepID=UPI000710C254|nr:DUF456 domain-containing protein [Phycicoccus sp. Soil803]KRF25192.1 hypothetical protein ASG95_12330 [Phycicoccus sp. Soil803]